MQTPANGTDERLDLLIRFLQEMNQTLERIEALLTAPRRSEDELVEVRRGRKQR